MSKADQFRANALHEIGEDYQWGHEGTGGVAGNDDYDCSGFYHAMLTDVGVKDSRTTAEGYRVRGVRIVNPSRVGQDFAVQGTPAIIMSDGEMLPGYLPPEALVKHLQDEHL